MERILESTYYIHIQQDSERVVWTTRGRGDVHANSSCYAAALYSGVVGVYGGPVVEGRGTWRAAKDEHPVGKGDDTAITVSYTHLTLPTNREV